MGNTTGTTTGNKCKNGYLLRYELESKQFRRYYAMLDNHTLKLYEHEFITDNKPDIVDLTQFNDIEMSSDECNRYQFKLLANDTKNDLIFIASLDWVKYIEYIISNNNACNNERNEEVSRLKMENERLQREKVEAILNSEEEEKKVMDKEKEIELLTETLKEKDRINEDGKFEWRWKKNNEWTSSRNVTKRTNKLNINDRINFIWPETDSEFEIYRETLKMGHLRCISTNESWKIKRVDLRKEIKELKNRNDKLMKENQISQELRTEMKELKNMNDILMKEIKELKNMNAKLINENKEMKELKNINDELMVENEEMKELKNSNDKLIKQYEERKQEIKHIRDNSIWINGNYENIKHDVIIGYNLLFIRDKTLHSYRAMLDGINNIAVLLNEEGIKSNLKKLDYPHLIIGEVFQIIQGRWPQTIGYLQKGDPVYIVTAGCLKQVQFDQSHSTESKKEEKKTENEILLKKVSIINDGPYIPNEQRQTGWIIKNITDQQIDIKANLVRIDGDSNVEINYYNNNKTIPFRMRPNDETFVFIQVKAPKLPNKYQIYYELVLENDNKRKICDILQLSVFVKREFSEEKENKIATIFEMGFINRKKIIQALKKWNWDQMKAVNWLATH